MNLSGTTSTPEPTPTVTKKRGRKPKTTTNYFDVREETAVRMFLSASTYEEKNQIYNEYLILLL